MKIGYLSDLHLEFRGDIFEEDVLDYLNEGSKNLDLLVIAGDICSNKKRRENFLYKLEHPCRVTLGNHDFKDQEVHDDFFDENGIVSAGLWTNFGNNIEVEQRSLTDLWDFRWINNWDINRCKELYESQLQKILDSPSEIVVTHFSPSLQSVDKQFIGDILNPYFCNDLDEVIKKSNKKIWIHGHIHSQWDYMIGDCRVLANPWGYPNEVPYKLEIKVIDV